MVLACACGQKMKVPADALGKTYKCVRCAQKVVVTAENSEGGPVAATAAVPPAAPAERIGQMLIEEGLISQAHLEEALAYQCERGGKTFDILIEIGHLDKEALHAFLSRQPGIATIDLSRFSIDRDLVRLIPRSMALEQSVLPIDRLGKLLTVAMACPIDTATIAEMERITQLKVKAVLCKLDDLRAVVAKYYRDPNEVQDPSGGFALFGGSPSRIRFDPSDTLANLAALPVAPEAARALAALAGTTPFDPAAALAACAGDPALAATVLRAANSAAYGMKGSVDNLAVAVALLGPAALAALAEGAAAQNLPSDPLLPLREHAAQTAQTAAALARVSGAVAPGVALTAGVLHNVGAFALAACAPDKYRFVTLNQSAAAVREAEEKVFSLSSPTAGARLLGAWECPVLLQETVGSAASLADAGEDRALAVLVHAAVLLVDAAPEEGASTLAPLSEALMAMGIEVSAAVKAHAGVRAA
jgi:HD-like signal output (HDOD) protein